MFKALVAALFTLVVIHTGKSVRRDYQKFLSLGPGGTPQTFPGYLRVKVLALFALRDRYNAPVSVTDCLHYKKGYLTELPQRQGERPQTDGIAPHRQTTQQASKEMFSRLAVAIEAFAPGVNNDLTIGTSCFEKHGTGLFSTCPANQTCRGEVVHVHPSDGSMHLTLHPVDANVVLRAGWGERHPIAGVFYGRFLPKGFVMLYAPHDEQQLEVVLEVVKAACWFVCRAPDGETRGLDVQVEDPRSVLKRL